MTRIARSPLVSLEVVSLGPTFESVSWVSGELDPIGLISCEITISSCLNNCLLNEQKTKVKIPRSSQVTKIAW